ncbi:MAG: putative rane protein [Herbinix sp.]|nr:putative rane protein [Herbinix sp.]
MDNRNEDSMVRQIEKNLSQNMNDNLFLVGKEQDGRMNQQTNSLVVNHQTSKPGTMNAFRVEETYFSGNNKIRRDISTQDPDFPLVSYEHITDSLAIPRAEYIRQAREACLRQLSDLQIYSKPYDVNYYINPETATSDESTPPKKSKTWNLFREGHEDRRSEDNRHAMDATNHSMEGTPQELVSFRFLVVRMVCAVVLFLTIFIVDKLDLRLC